MMYYGACYYPEHWPQERWARDARMMKEAGFNVVRMAEFAWAVMEPAEGQYDFAWLDRVMELFEQQEIKVILGTPTAGPPKWLMDRHPDIYPRDAQGRARGFGARRHYCFNNPNFHRYTAAIVTAMAAHYGGNSQVVGWQIDNEMGMINTTRCYCDNCLQAFRRWLQNKYKTLDAVNAAWGTVFSSQTYHSWEAIHLPAYAIHPHHSPGMALDYYRFASDSVIAYQQLQADIIREHATGQPVTTNQMGKFNEINCFEQSVDLDLSSLDLYPIMKSVRADRPAYAAFQLDATYGFKLQNFWVLEHQSGTPGAVVMSPTPAPGELRRWTMQSVARGADGIVYFRWRTLNVSIEELWHGILQHHGEPGRKYEEVKRVGAELGKLAPLLAGSHCPARVGMIRSYDNEWSLEFQPHVKNYEYMKHFELYYRYFFDRNIPVHVIAPTADFSGYDVLIAPNLMMADQETIDKLHAFVRGGGRLVMDYRAGAKLMDNSMALTKLPGAYRELLGIEIEDYGIMEAEMPNRVRFAETGQEAAANVWYDVIELNEAEAVAVYTSNYFADAPAVTRRAYGEGAAYYLGTEPDAAGLGAALDLVSREAKLEPALTGLPAGVEAAARICADGKAIVFVINHTDDPQRIDLPGAYTDVLTGRTLSGEVELAAQDVVVLAAIEH